MPLLGTAAVAMWWTIAADHLAEFGDWHAHEHFPERLGIPGFRRGTRWSGIREPGRTFVMYELDSYDVLTSPGYQERLNDPTPWSTTMMPYHLGMVRSQCRIAASYGSGIAGFASTIRLSPAPGAASTLAGGIEQALQPLPAKAGLLAAHLLVTENPHLASPTKEQRIRGGDDTADWIIVLLGYDLEVVRGEADQTLGAARLAAMGAQEAISVDYFQLAVSLTSVDAGSPLVGRDARDRADDRRAAGGITDASRHRQRSRPR